MQDISTTLIGPLIPVGDEGRLTVYGKKSQDINIHTCKMYLYHAINSQAPSSLNTAARVIDTFPRTIKGLLRKLYLEFNIVNNAGSALGMNPFVFLINYIDFKVGAKVIAKWYGEDLYQANNFTKTDYELYGEQAQTNISEATYLAYTATLAAAATQFVRLDLSPIIQTLNGLLIDGFSDDISIEINTRQANQWCTAATAGAANVATNSWALQYGFELLSDEDYAIRYNAHRANAFEYKYVEPIQQIQAFPSLSSNVQYNYTLKPYNAKVHAFFFTLRPQGAINESLFTYYPLGLIYLKDNDNRIIGDYQTPGQWVQQNSLDDFPLNFYLSRLSVYPWVFSRAIVASMKTGISVGSLYFTGQNESFYFSASGSLSGVNTEMVVCGLIESKLKSVQGSAMVSRVVGFY
jgi:hypothetical protein